MVLYYRIPYTRYEVKVDLLLSTEPDLEIPYSLRPSHCSFIDNLLVAPLYFVLYHKLIGWDHRVDSPDDWRREKAAKDYQDIIGLCRCISRDRIQPLSKAHMGRLYLDNFSRRADTFVDWYGKTAGVWFRRIGFNV